MKYEFSYALIHSMCASLARTLLLAKRIEINHLLSLLNSTKSQTILDYGCNDGYYTNLIQNCITNKNICGTDINSHALDLARERYLNINFYDANDEFILKNKFDIIIVSHVLEHIKERDEFMRKLADLLSEDGLIIITVPQERFRGESAIFPMLFNVFKLRPENPHVINFRCKDLKELFDKTGLKIKDCMYINHLPPLKSTNRTFCSLSLIVSVQKNKGST